MKTHTETLCGFEKRFDEERSECTTKSRILCQTANCRCGRKMLQTAVCAFIRDNMNVHKMYSTTIFLDRDLILYDQLTWKQVLNSARAVKRYLRTAGSRNVRAIGFPDFELTTGHNLNPRKRFWHLHWHLIMECRRGYDIPRKLASSIKSTESAERPVKSQSVYDLEGVILYCLKSIEAMRRVDRAPDGRRHPKRKLRFAELQVLRSFVSTTELHRWIFTFGFDRAKYRFSAIEKW